MLLVAVVSGMYPWPSSCGTEKPADELAAPPPQVAACAALRGSKAPARTGTQTRPRLAVADAITKQLDAVTKALPVELEATQPEQVGTVVPVCRQASVVSMDPCGDNGCRYTTTVTVIGLETRHMLATNVFVGAGPAGHRGLPHGARRRSQRLLCARP